MTPTFSILFSQMPAMDSILDDFELKDYDDFRLVNRQFRDYIDSDRFWKARAGECGICIDKTRVSLPGVLRKEVLEKVNLTIKSWNRSMRAELGLDTPKDCIKRMNDNMQEVFSEKFSLSKLGMEKALHIEHTDPFPFKVTSILPALTQLQILSLSNCRLAHVPWSVVKLTRLRHLRLENVDISAVPAFLENLTRLRSIHITRNRLQTFNLDVACLPHIAVLYLRCNGLTSLDGLGRGSTTVTELSLSANSLARPKLGHFPSLRVLELQNCDLRFLDPEIGRLTQLESLGMAFNPLEELPEEIFSLTSLKILDLRENKLTSLSDRVLQLTQLTQFLFIGNPFQSLPDLTQFNDMRTNCRLFEMELTKIPRWISTSTTSLVMFQNKLTNEPDFPFQTFPLKELHLADNLYREWPTEFNGLTRLENLDLRSNFIESIPDHVSALRALRCLRIGDNKIRTISPALKNLGLRVLNLATNQISDMEVLCSCTTLRILSLSENRIPIIPNEITNLVSLTEFYITSNLITQFPVQMTTLTSITTVELYDNPLESAPIGIRGRFKFALQIKEV